MTSPTPASFEDAIAQTQELLDQVFSLSHSRADHPLADQFVQTATALVQTETTGRGFLATFMNDDRAQVEEWLPTLATVLTQAPTVALSLVVKNLAMSTAMGIYHRRRQNAELASGADRVQARSTQLMKLLNTPELHTEAQALVQSIDASGPYTAFLERWGYDDKQKAAIRAAIVAVLTA